MPISRVPSYRLHRPTGQAVVTLGGRDYYLGLHGSPKSKTRYQKLLAGWLQAEIAPPRPFDPPRAGSTVLMVAEAYLGQLNGRYVKAGRPTRQLDRLKSAVRFLIADHGEVVASNFSGDDLRDILVSMARAGRPRIAINQLTTIIRAIINWGVERKLVDASVDHELRAVRSLKRGAVLDGVQTRETKPIRKVQAAVLERTTPHMPDILKYMVVLERLTGMRPCELCGLRPGDLNRDGEGPDGTILAGVWVYEVSDSFNKNAHRGLHRWVLIGPKGQAVLTRYLNRSAGAYCFSPREACERSLKSQGRRVAFGESRQPGQHYSTASYGRAVAKACQRAEPGCWGDCHPSDLPCVSRGCSPR